MIPPDERPLTLPTRLIYRERWTIVFLVGGAALMIGAIVILPVASRADVTGVGKVVGLLLAVVAATAALRFRVAVVLNADRLLVRTWSTRGYAWADIYSIVVEVGLIAVTTPSGTAYLPLGSTTPGRCEGDPALGQAVSAAWIERRGDPWFPPPAAPWSPPRDLDDRVVIRNAFRPPAWVVPFLAYPGTRQLLDPTVPITDGILVALMVYGGVAGLLALVHWRQALIINHDEIVVRWLFWARRIPRSIVLGVDLKQPHPAGGWMAPQRPALRPVGWTAPMRVRILTSDGYEPVPVPASGGFLLGHDPVFFRKLAWLDQALRAPADSAAGPAADR